MAWRLQRSVYFAFGAVALILVVYAVLNGLHIEHFRHEWLSAPCKGGNGSAIKYRAFCQAQYTNYVSALSYGLFIHWAAVIPTTVLGLLLGANLVAGEFDHHTTRSAWTQSITRSRWFETKVAVGLGSLILLAVPLCVTVSWWLNTARWTPRISTDGFTYAGWMPLAMGVFSFAVTTIAGTILRRPGWAIAVGLAVMVLVPWAMQTDVRTNLVPLRSTTLTFTAFTKQSVTVFNPTGEAPSNAWVVFNGVVPVRYGHTLPTISDETSWRNAANRCPAYAAKYTACLKKLGLHEVELYIADGQYWVLQLREGGVYLVGTAILLGAGLLLVRRSRA